MGIKEENNALRHGLNIDIELKNYNRWIYENIREALGKRILEIGCGIGAMIDLASARGRKITGVDIDEHFLTRSKLKYAKNADIKIIKSDCMDLDRKFKKGSFDTVTIINVLEHIKRQEKAVRIMNKLLSAGGKLTVFVPAFQCIFGKLDKDLGHYRRYTKTTLRKVLEQNGFEIEKMHYMNFIGFFGWYFNSKLLGRGLTPVRQSLFFDKYIVPAEKMIEKIIKPPIGQSIIAIAVKKSNI
jgi:ubiquinone/menaquinone biosynthesis C-methylase UbiE